MAPRRYQQSRRLQNASETRQRILDATVALHAEKGSAATSYADIARRADVAVPTVYKHFPDRRTLYEGCVGHASAAAPPVGPQVFEALPDPRQRIAALLTAIYRAHEYFEPWMRWRDDRHDRELAAVIAPQREQLRELLAAALAPPGHAPAQAVALADALADYAAWENLVRRHGLSCEDAAQAAASAIAPFLPQLEGASR